MTETVQHLLGIADGFGGSTRLKAIPRHSLGRSDNKALISSFRAASQSRTSFSRSRNSTRCAGVQSRAAIIGRGGATAGNAAETRARRAGQHPGPGNSGIAPRRPSGARWGRGFGGRRPPSRQRNDGGPGTGVDTGRFHLSERLEDADANFPGVELEPEQGGQPSQLEIRGIRSHWEPARLAVANERAAGLGVNQRHVELAGGLEPTPRGRRSRPETRARAGAPQSAQAQPPG